MRVSTKIDVKATVAFLINRIEQADITLTDEDRAILSDDFYDELWWLLHNVTRSAVTCEETKKWVDSHHTENKS